jgi:predicted RNA methylase
MSTAQPIIDIPEISLSYTREGRNVYGKVEFHKGNAVDIIRSLFPAGTLEMQEHLIVLYLNNSNDVIGYYCHSIGGITATIVDIRLILAAAIKSLAVKIIIAHNHPSGNLKASEADDNITRELKNACRELHIDLLDSLIITTTGYTSLAEKGLMGLKGIPEKPVQTGEAGFVEKMEADLVALVKHDNRSTRKLAATFGITSGRLIKELTELAIVNTARKYAHGQGAGIDERYGSIVELYNTQINLAYRDSETYLLQQYSTPAPVAFLMGMYCGIDRLGQTGGYLFEPSAGNGILTIAADPARVYVNEVSESRHANLLKQGFANVFKRDAASPSSYIDLGNTFSAVLTNPPFGTLDKPVKHNGYLIRHLDHIMVLYALETMAVDGRAAFIIGGHHSYDSLGRLSQGKNRILFNYLYRHYHVEDVLQLDGRQLYTRQGTGFNVRVILVNGRKQTPSGNAPMMDAARDKVITSFEQLWQRIQPLLPSQSTNNGHMNSADKLAALRQQAAKLKNKLGGQGLEGVRVLKITEEYTDTLYLRKSYTAEGVFVYAIAKIKNGVTHIHTKEPKRSLWKKIPSSLLKNRPFSKRPFTIGQPVNQNDIFCIMALLQEYLRCFDRTLYSIYAAARIARDAGDYNRMIMIGIWEGFTAPVNWNETDYTNLCHALRSIGQHEICDALEKHFSYGKRGHTRRSDPGEIDWELGAVYQSQSKSKSLETHVPDSMADETHAVLKRVEKEVGGDIDNFVRDRLGYPTKETLFNALSAEQVDAVALAIYNIEGLEQSLIVGDMTGIGKGRIAAALIRYGVLQGKRPVFLTIQPNLFSDIYRDLKAIGSGQLVPFIFNAAEAKSDIKDEDGNVVYSALSKAEQQAIFDSGELPAKYDYAVATYSQFNSPERRTEKPLFLKDIARGSIMVLDEAHTASGTGNTGRFMQDVTAEAGGVLFLSATYAKEPANMPLYARKTCISEASISKDGLVSAFSKGGVALQEVVASLIVREGQMIRRERTYEGIEVSYTTLTEKAYEHKTISDNITAIMRDIINFQQDYVKPVITDMDAASASGGEQVVERSGTATAGIDNKPYYSKIFQVIHQMLFSIKAEEVAHRAIEHLREGRKPVIAFSSTMASFVDELVKETGGIEEDGTRIPVDFSYVLQKGLDGVLRYSVVQEEGFSEPETLSLSELSVQGRNEYERISTKIKHYTSGISISPIDIVLETIRKAGFKAIEVTGRSLTVDISADRKTGLVKPRKRISTFDAFRLFNDNEIDVLLINQSGSTGASAHAVPTKKVPADEVKQRVMLILQAELDINQEIQKRGRINRTGQILKPRYEYISSAIPAEQRLMMMLQEKLKSLDANTSSNQKQSSAMLNVADFLNKIGNDVVKEYLLDFPDVNKLLNEPLKSDREDFAHFVTGRVAVLPSAMQQDFYNEVTERYLDTVDYLKQVDEYDLEMETLNLQAQTKHRQVIVMGKGGYSAFGGDTFLETCSANVLRKPMTPAEIKNFLEKEDSTRALVNPEVLTATIEQQIAKEQLEINTEYDLDIALIPTQKKLEKLKAENRGEEYLELYGEIKDKIEGERKIKLQKVADNYNGRLTYLKNIFTYFYPGRQLHYPHNDETQSGILTQAIFLGFLISKNSRKPFAPSSIKLQFALNSTQRLISLPASKRKEVLAVMGANVMDAQMDMEDYLEAWEEERKRLNADRHTRYIVTGNLLQGMDKMPGKLVSYTLLDGGTSKGILLPEYWQPLEEDFFVSVPLHGAISIVRSLVDGKSVETTNGISLIRQGMDFRIIVSANRQKAGDIFTDAELLELLRGKNFEKVANKMAAHIPYDNLETALLILQDKFGATLLVPKDEVKIITPSDNETYARKPIAAPQPYDPDKDIQVKLKLVKLKAKALELKLKLMAA